MKNKKDRRIGIVGWSVGDNSFGVTKQYLQHISRFGSPVILLPTKSIDTSLDLVILPGGKDTFSGNYGEAPGFFNSDSDQFKDFFLKYNLPRYIEAQVPIWGTCLGFQQIVCHFGGKLIQNINLESHGYSDPRSEGVHKLIFSPEWKWWEDGWKKSMQERKKKKDADLSISTCSLHHQGVYYKELPDELELVARTSDGIVEIIRHKTLPIAAGQNHVEEDFSPICNYLIEELLNYEKNEEAVRDAENKSESIS